MAATVTGVFRIIDRASGPMDKMRRHAEQLDRAMVRAGRRMDTAFGDRRTRQLELMERSFQNLNREVDQHDSAINRVDRDHNRFSRSVRKAKDEMGGFERAMRKVLIVTGGLGRVLAPAKMLAIGAGIGVVVQAVVALAGGLGAMLPNIVGAVGGIATLLPRLGQLGALAAALPATIAGIGLAMATVKLATKDLSEAMGGNEQALARLTPQAREFVKTLQSFKPELETLRRSAQGGLFGGLSVALQRMRAGLPVVNDLLKGMSRTLGDLAKQAAARFTSRGALQDLLAIGKTGTNVVGAGGRSLINILDALRNFAFVARPFTLWLAKLVEGWSQFILKATQAGRATGTIAAWLRRAQVGLTQLGHIVRDVFFAMLNIFKAMRGPGDSLWKSIERAAAAFRKWTSSAEGMARMRLWFRHSEHSLRVIWDLLKQVVRIFVAFGRAARTTGNSLWRTIDRVAKRTADWMNSYKGQTALTLFFIRTRRGFVEIARLAEDLGRAITRMGQTPGFQGIVRGLRELVPLLESMLTNLARGLAPAIVRLLISIGKLFDRLSSASGPVARIIGFLAKIIDAITWLIDHIPGLGAVFTALFATFLIDVFITRVQRLAASWGMVATEATGAAAAQGRATGAAAGGGLLAGGVGRMGARGIMGNVGSIGLLAGSFAAQQLGAPQAISNTLLGAGLGNMIVPGWGALAGAGLGAGYSLYQSLNRPQATYDPTGYNAKLSQMVLPWNVDRTGRVSRPGATEANRIRGTRLLQSPGTREQVETNLGAINRIRETVRLDMVRKNLSKDNLENARQYLDFLEAQRQQQQGILDVMKERERVAAGMQQAEGRSFVGKRLEQTGQRYGTVYKRTGSPQEGMKAVERTVTKDLPGVFAKGDAAARIYTNRILKWLGRMQEANPKLKGVADVIRNDLFKAWDDTGKKWSRVGNTIVTTSKTQLDQWVNILATHADRGEKVVSKSFQAIRDKAVAMLTQMGFSASSASTIVAQVEGGAPAAAVIPTQQVGQALQGKLNPATGATGMRIGGKGLRDTVPVAPGHMAAPGELIVNRHTESRVNHLLAGAGTSLGREVGRESKPHYLPVVDSVLPDKRFAEGGRVGGFPAMMMAANRMDAAGFPYVYGGGHSTPVPFGPVDCSAAVSYVLQQGGALGPTGTSSSFMSYGAPGPGLVTIYARGAGRTGHTFMSMAGRMFGTSTQNPGGGAGWFESHSTAGFTVRHVPDGMIGGGSIPSLMPAPSGLGGYPGVLVDQAGRLYGGALTQGINKALMNPATYAGMFAGGGDFTANRPTTFTVGEAGPEHVSITPLGRSGGGGRTGVRIGQIIIQNHRRGDIQKQIEEEVSAAFDHLASVLETQPVRGDEGVLRG